MDDGTRRCAECGIELRRLVDGRGRWPVRCPSCQLVNRRRIDQERNLRRAEYLRTKSARWYAANREYVSSRDKAKLIAAPEQRRERARRYAADHRDAARTRAREWAASHPDRRREQWARRKARKLGNGFALYSRQAIFDRDGWVCQLCGDPIDRLAKAPAPLSASIDHIVPLIMGGPDTLDNVQAAHLLCNCRKSRR